MPMSEKLLYSNLSLAFFGLLAVKLLRNEIVEEPLEAVLPLNRTWIEEDIKVLCNRLVVRNCSPDTPHMWMSVRESWDDLGLDCPVVVDCRGHESTILESFDYNRYRLSKNLIFLTECGHPISKFRKIDLNGYKSSLLETLVSVFGKFAERLETKIDPLAVAVRFRHYGLKNTMTYYKLYSESVYRSLLEPIELENFCRDMCTFWTYDGRPVEHQTLSQWIAQFKSDEAKIGACNLLEFMHKKGFMSLHDIVSAISHQIKKLKVSHPDARVIDIQVSGKSESMLHYELRNEKGNILQLNDVIEKDESRTLIIVDDVIGSGKTIIDCLFGGKGTVDKGVLNNWLKRAGNSIHVVAAVASESGKIAIETDPRCQGSVTVHADDAIRVGVSVFLEGAEIFRDDEVRISFQKECELQGNQLFARYPLGWGNCAWAVATSYNVPNCSLPIIWSSAFGWHALLERR